MKFSKNWTKLEQDVFTTIRKNTNYYYPNKLIKIRTPKAEFLARIIERTFIKKEDITEDIARKDADCSREELITILEGWYGKQYNDFVFLTIRRERPNMQKSDSTQDKRIE
jgi:hypothetical protein